MYEAEASLSELVKAQQSIIASLQEELDESKVQYKALNFKHSKARRDLAEVIGQRNLYQIKYGRLEVEPKPPLEPVRPEDEK